MEKIPDVFRMSAVMISKEPNIAGSYLGSLQFLLIPFFIRFGLKYL